MAICCLLQCWNHTSVFGQTLCLTSLLPQGDVGMVGDAAVLSGRDAITQSRALSPSRSKNASSISLSPSTEDWCLCLRFGRLPSVALHVSPPESSALWFFTVRTQCVGVKIFSLFIRQWNRWCLAEKCWSLYVAPWSQGTLHNRSRWIEVVKEGSLLVVSDRSLEHLSS